MAQILRYASGDDYFIIYRLVMRNHDFNAFWKIPSFGWKMGVAATLKPKGLGPQDPTKKKLANCGWTFCVNSYLKKTDFKYLGPEPPPL